MTHCGPYLSATSKSHDDYDTSILSGSQTYGEFLKENAEYIVVNVHGHSHDGVGYNRVRNLKVILNDSYIIRF